jgi:hypothetical protein
VIVDGQSVGVIDLSTPLPQRSSAIFEHVLPAGYHAVVLKVVGGAVPCDTLEVIYATEH